MWCPLYPQGSEGKRKHQRSHHICNGPVLSLSPDHVNSASRHHTFKYMVAPMKNTLVFENHFESNKYRVECLFRRREEMNLRWEQDINSLRRKRETTTEWHWSSLAFTLPYTWSPENWKGSEVFDVICGRMKNIHCAQQRNPACSW